MDYLKSKGKDAIPLEGKKFLPIGSEKVALALPVRVSLGKTDGSNLTSPRVDVPHSMVGKLLAVLIEVSALIS